jgi:hypothetical protein
MKGAGLAQANPALEPRSHDVEQRAIDERMRVQMMMGIDETAFEARGLKKLPLPRDFAAHQFAGLGEKGRC